MTFINDYGQRRLLESQTTLNTNVSGHDARIETLENAGYITSSALSPYATASSVNTGLSGKVDHSTLTSDYTSTSALNTLLDGKVDHSTLTNDYTTTSDLNTALGNKVDTTTLTNDYTTNSSLNTLLNGKVDTSTLATHYTTNSGLYTLLNAKVSNSTLTSDYMTAAAINAALDGKQDAGDYLTDVQVGTVSTGSAAVTATTSGSTTTLNFTLPVSPFVSSGNDIYYTSGDVGIGTSTSPLSKLQIHEGDGEGTHRTLTWSSMRSDASKPLLGYLGTAASGAYASGGLGLFQNTLVGGTEDETVRIQANGETWFNGGDVGIGGRTVGLLAPLHVSMPGTRDYGGYGSTPINMSGDMFRIANRVTGTSQYTHNEYGIQFGVSGSGNGNIQTYGYDHGSSTTTANYDLLLQPAGGNVTIGENNNGTAKFKFTTGSQPYFQMRGEYPTINLRDTNNYHAYLHCNDNKFYILSSGADDDDDGQWTQVANGRWPFFIDLTNNNIYAGGNIDAANFFVGFSDSRGIGGVTGQFGTVQTTGAGVGGWQGYSIDGQFVFMGNGTTCGIYNDIDNEWFILCERNGTTQIKYNGSLRYWASSGNYFYGNGAQIYGVETTRNYTNAGSDWWTNGGSIQADPPNLNFGLYVQHAIRSPTYVAFSDRRIKRDFLELDDSVALEKLRQLRPTSYRYKERTRNTTDRVIGFVAQEVAEVLPDAVSTAPNIIPSIQTEASVTKIGEAQFEFTLLEPHTVSVGATLVLKTPKEVHMECKVETVTDDTTFTGKVTSSQVLPDDAMRVWVTGEMVDDFHHLDKNAIFTVATSALQEVDRQLQAEKTKVADLLARVEALESGA